MTGREKTDRGEASKTSTFFSVEVSDEQISVEKRKARELRRSAWWKRKLEKGICYYCGGRFPGEELTMDHLVPLIRGGRTTKSNCVSACKECNNKKKYLLPVEWEEYLQRLGG